MSHFRLLSDPQTYVAHDWNLVTDSAARAHWLDHFASHFQQVLKAATMQYGRIANKPVTLASAAFNQMIDKLKVDPAALPSGKLNVIELCRYRESVLRANKLNDPFKHVKDRENASAAKLYPQVVRKIHAMPYQDKWMHAIECVFAGNIFDLGSGATMHLATEPTDFLNIVENVQPRPWRIDDYDRLAQDLPARPPVKWSKAVVFVDNAGSDLILGIMPLVRELGLLGTKIVLAANELPSLNDVTVDETARVVTTLAANDADLAALIEAGMFEVVSSGNDIPLIDLSNVSDELNEAAEGAELVILEGMGRAVESNLDAKFSVDCLKLAMLKDLSVAARVGGEVFDCVCKYEPVG